MENEGTLPLRQLVGAVTAEAMWRQEERLRALEARVDSLEESIQRALETVFPRVDALVTQLEKQNLCSTRGCPTSTDSGLSDQLAQVSISAVRSQDHTGSVSVQSASCNIGSCSQNAHPPAFLSVCAHPPVNTSASAGGGRSSRRSRSPTVQGSLDTPPSPSGSLFNFAPCTSASLAFPAVSVSNSDFPSLPRIPASTISTTAVDGSPRFSFSSTNSSPSVSQPSGNSSFNPIMCSARSPLPSRVVTSEQPVNLASSVTTTSASLPCNTNTSWIFHSSPSQGHFSGGSSFSTNITSTVTNVSVPSFTSCIVSNPFSSIGSGGSLQLTSAVDAPNAGSFHTATQTVSPSSAIHTPSSSSFTSSSTQQDMRTRASTRTPIASPRSAVASFASTPSSSVQAHASSSPSDTIPRSYSSAFVSRFPSTPTSSDPSLFNVPNVFGLSCVPSAWR